MEGGREEEGRNVGLKGEKGEERGGGRKRKEWRFFMNLLVCKWCFMFMPREKRCLLVC